MMAYYILLKFFQKFEVDDLAVEWHGKGGVIGVIPVYNNLNDLKRQHPGQEYLEISEILGQS